MNLTLCINGCAVAHPCWIAGYVSPAYGVMDMDCNDGLAWLGFWIFAAVFIAGDYWLFSQGYDTFFQSHKTEAEKKIQQIKIDRLRDKAKSET
jgi:hypothetical protein